MNRNMPLPSICHRHAVAVAAGRRKKQAKKMMMMAIVPAKSSDLSSRQIFGSCSIFPLQQLQALSIFSRHFVFSISIFIPCSRRIPSEHPPTYDFPLSAFHFHPFHSHNHQDHERHPHREQRQRWAAYDADAAYYRHSVLSIMDDSPACLYRGILPIIYHRRT